MLWFATALGSALVFGLAGLLMKVSQMRGGARSSLLLGLYAAGACGFFAQALIARTWEPLDWRIWAWGAVVGLGSAWGNLLFMKALDYGPASLTSPLTNANIVFVVGMGALWFGEPVRAIALAGVAALLAAVVLLSLKTEGSYSISDKRWYPLVAGAMLLFVFRNGGLKVTDSLGLDSSSVLWAGYLLSWLWFGAVSRLERSRNRPDAGATGIGTTDIGTTNIGTTNIGTTDIGTTESRVAGVGHSPRSIGWFWGLAAGVCSYGGLQLYAIAIAQGPSYLVAPIFATNSLVVAFGSLLLYREKLTRLQAVALLLLLAGLLLVRA
ncbi:hypothetical protein J19TS2_06380 [Cohnella xylanilytica]|uniref:DMT family transporter n=1 Tax=Cohnella xylanilytica TaxID=557555 RepID=UPI001B1DBCF0|nr:DMT family transporter [Cohnella xylanilytica]GIO11083.1 hypothetical protein J19TS2_06380 [Cohnella xylanilytica]